MANRLSLLPAFPSLHQHGVVVYRDREHLLLANVPRHRLTAEQQCMRQRNIFPLPFSLTDERATDNVLPSFLLNVDEQLYADLYRRLNVDKSILDYNYGRLSKCLQIMTYERVQRRLQVSSSSGQEYLPLHEYPLALEFYLQTDADLFYMKTCHFRGARPLPSPHHGLFLKDEPQVRYGMVQCSQRQCHFCYPSPHVMARRHRHPSFLEPVVHFTAEQKHRFVNGYEAILNCPTSCETQNIIYALTCPCGQFDYIGYTSMTLGRRLAFHRQHGNRILREFLLGSNNIYRLDAKEKTQEDLMKDAMLLYRHSARCPMVMQWFLDCNPQFWSFVPSTLEAARLDNATYELDPSLPLDPVSTVTSDAQTRSDFDAGIFLTDLPPLPSSNYTFSNRQCVEQFCLVKYKRNRLLVNPDLDLYNASIVAVLPESCSETLQRFVECLFITHAETKLNTIGHLDANVIQQSEPLFDSAEKTIIADRGDWCRDLRRPPAPQ